jgi:hypothetical protein
MKRRMADDIGISVGQTQEFYAEVLRDRILEKICRKLLGDLNFKSFHRVEMVTDAFYDKAESDRYRYSTQDTEYTRLLELVYRPIIDRGMLVEYENNNMQITESLPPFCRRELQSKEYIDWRNIHW